MRAAIYARKSTEQNGVADEQKSVARQVEHARAYARREARASFQVLIMSEESRLGREAIETAYALKQII